MGDTSSAQARGILPIPDVAPVGLTTYDAKDPDTFPPIEPLLPPEGARATTTSGDEPACPPQPVVARHSAATAAATLAAPRRETWRSTGTTNHRSAKAGSGCISLDLLTRPTRHGRPR
jgi:hypothetical protein